MWYKPSMMPIVRQNRFLTWMTAQFALMVVLLLVVSVCGAASVRSATYPTLGLTTQNDQAINTIKTSDGYLLVWNRPDLHFTLLIKGKDIKPLNDPEHVFFNVDGMVFQVQLASISEFAPEAKEKRLDDKAILDAHRDWESKFLEGLLGNKLKLESFNAKLSAGGEASLWQFDMPEGMNAEARKQLYLTVVRGDYVLLLNSVATATISEETSRKFLLDTMSTVKMSSTPIDVKKLSESVRKGVNP
jgi:hypothetical protein